MGNVTSSRAAAGRPLWRRPGSMVAAAAAVLALAAGAVAGLAARGGPHHDSRRPNGQAGTAQLARPAAPPVFSAYSLAPKHGALFGAWVQPPQQAAADPGKTATQIEQSAVAGFEHTIGRTLAINNLYVAWADPMPVSLAAWDLSRGTIPMISWAAAPTNQIAAGRFDAQIRAQARQLKRLHGPVFLRWFAEMDIGESQADAVSPASYIAAWRHMHKIFAEVDATNVRWVWCPNSSGFGKTNPAASYYPGKAYVDWIGTDGYNWGRFDGRGRWQSFQRVVLPFYRWGVSTGKPMLMGEFGTVEGKPGQKAAWFQQAAEAIQTEFPAIRAVVYFESEHVNYDRKFDWRVTTSKTALAAFRAFAHNPYFDAPQPITKTPLPGGPTEDSSP